MAKNKPSIELSVDFKEDIEKVSEEEKVEQQFLSDEMEKIASEELTEDTSEDTPNGKTFVSEE